MKILVTGSHFTPAQATIEGLKNIKGIDLVYVGRSTTIEGDRSSSVESSLFSSMGVKFIPLTSGRLQRSFSRYTIISLSKIPIGFLQAFYILIREKPNLVLSFGGYTAVPIVITAWFLSVPIIIHEQTLEFGLANIISSFFAKKIAVSFDKKYKVVDSKKIVLTGLPIRRGVLEPKQVSERYVKYINEAKSLKRNVVLITGGNQGSHIINRAVADSLKDLTPLAFYIHQTGDSGFSDFEMMDSKIKEIGCTDNFIIQKWINENDLGFLLANCDLAISRGGINTLVEFAMIGVPAIVIPIEDRVLKEQKENAKFFEKLKVAFPLAQSELTGVKLVKRIKVLLLNSKKIKADAKKVKNLFSKDAGKRLIVEVLTSLKW